MTEGNGLRVDAREERGGVRMIMKEGPRLAEQGEHPALDQKEGVLGACSQKDL